MWLRDNGTEELCLWYSISTRFGGGSKRHRQGRCPSDLEWLKPQKVEREQHSSSPAVAIFLVFCGGERKGSAVGRACAPITPRVRGMLRGCPICRQTNASRALLSRNHALGSVLPFIRSSFFVFVERRRRFFFLFFFFAWKM